MKLSLLQVVEKQITKWMNGMEELKKFELNFIVLLYGRDMKSDETQVIKSLMKTHYNLSMLMDGTGDNDLRK